jgi:hypothetical protein
MSVEPLSNRTDVDFEKRLRPLQTQEFVARDEEVGEPERDEEAVHAFRDTAVADFVESPKALDDVEGVLDCLLLSG